jgi:hypothetical protein
MNIFVLDQDPTIAATYHNDRHVVKMILESSQLLSIAHYKEGVASREVRFSRAHINHPVAIWTRASISNYDWLYILASALLTEYEARYGRVHNYAPLVRALQNCPAGITKRSLTSFVQCMPKQYQRANAVEAYRLYYIHEKAHIASWKPPARQPEWWRSGSGSLGAIRTGANT